MSSLKILIPEWVGNMDEQIKLLLERYPEPRTHEFPVEAAPRELLECMVLFDLTKDAGHEEGLKKEERKGRLLLLDAALAVKKVLLHQFSEQHPEARKGVTCLHVRNDGRIWSRPITLP